MNPFQFLKQLSQMPLAGGEGIRRKVQVPLTDLRTSTGLVLDASATNPRFAAAETNALVVSSVAGQTALGSFTFVVPADYDATADELKIVLLVESAGTADFPTLDATVFRKRAGAALSADLAPAASAAVVVLASERTISLSGNRLQAGDVLTINLVTSAHATDATHLHSIEMQYKGGIVLQTLSAR